MSFIFHKASLNDIADAFNSHINHMSGLGIMVIKAKVQNYCHLISLYAPEILITTKPNTIVNFI